MKQNSANDHSFFRFTTQRPVGIFMITIGIIIFGFISYERLALNLMPDITYPSLTVRTGYEGTAPEEVETSISRPIEEALGVVTNLVNVTSISKAGQSDVILEFNWDTDMSEAISEVREKLDRIFLPNDADKPLILKYDPSLDPILRLGLAGSGDLFFERYLAEEQIKRALETIPGVASVRVKGGYEEEIRVELDEQKITLIGLDIQQIRQRLAQENINLAGGELKEGQTEYIVRTLNEFRSIDEISELKLNNAQGRDIKLADVGKVYRTFKERQIITRLNSKEMQSAGLGNIDESVELEVYKEGDANIVQVAERVRERVFGTEAQLAWVEENKSDKEEETKEEAKEDSQAGGGGRRGGPGGAQMLERQMTNFIAYGIPENLRISLLSDQSVFIKNSIDEVKSTAMWGGVLAVLILLLFLRNLSSTVIVGLAIPISIIATFTPMRLFDVSLNIMSLGGLALGIGMLVDNSIVVIESIFRCREEGDSVTESVIRGTGEVGAAVTASTLTTIAVFFPMVFVQGIAGQIFGNLALTVVFSLLASLVVALFFIPMLASRVFNLPVSQKAIGTPAEFFSNTSFWTTFKNSLHWGSHKWSNASVLKRLWLAPALAAGLGFVILRLGLHTVLALARAVLTAAMTAIFAIVGVVVIVWNRAIFPVIEWVINKFNSALNILSDRYSSIISSALANKQSVLMMALIPFLLAVFVLLPRLGSELIPEVRQGEFNVELTLPIGTPVETTSEVIRPIEDLILANESVKQISTVAGIDITKVSDSESGEHTAKITVNLVDSNDPAALEDQVLESIRREISNYSGIVYNISRPVLFSFKTPVEVEIQGFNLAALAQVSRDAVKELEKVDGLTDVKSNLQRGNPEVQIIYDRERLAFYGLNIRTVAELVRNKVRGDVATQFKKEDRRIDVLVRVRDEDKASLANLKRLNVNPGGEFPISLESVSHIEINEGPSEIRRIDQERSAVILANIEGRDLSSVSEDVFITMQNMELPEGFSFNISGQNKEMEVSLGSLQLALLLAIFLVYIVMASQFESFVHPFVILFTVPFALIGVILILFLFNIPLNIMVFLGLIMLAGIVVNNAIVLVDYINQLRRKGMEKDEAIKAAGMARLRPILMTTATTVLGLFPMALGLGEGAEIRTPMAITVIAGLLSATFLTLVVTPTVYAIFDRSEVEVTESANEADPAISGA
ncbi:MAG: efflux RND transporter permease subunit [Calditrichia bacterium]